MNNVLVTGGAGFIGSHLVRMLLGQGKKVVNVDKLSYAGNMETIKDVLAHPKHFFIRSDICESGHMESLMRMHQVDTVINLAAESHVDGSIDNPLKFVTENTVGTCSLLQACLIYWMSLSSDFKYLQVSTDEVYGSCTEGEFTEETSYDPSSPYSASKASADHFVRAFNKTYGLPTFITNCSNNYGPHQYPEKLIPTMILRCNEKLELPVYGDGTQVRDWIHVEDHCSAILHVLEHGTIGETYLVGASCEVRNIDLVTLICECMDYNTVGAIKHRDLIRMVKDRPGHDHRYAVDWSKLESIGWSPAYNFTDAIRETVEWYLDNTEWIDAVSNKVHHNRQGTK